MQRLYAPVHHLRKAGEVLDRAHGDPGAGELPRGAAGGDDLDAEIGQARANSTTPDFSETETSALRTRHSPATARSMPVVSLCGAISPQTIQPAGPCEGWPDQSSARPQRGAYDLGEQLVLDRMQPRKDRIRVLDPGSSIARWAITGPVSTPPSTKWTVTPKSFTP